MMAAGALLLSTLLCAGCGSQQGAEPLDGAQGADADAEVSDGTSEHDTEVPSVATCASALPRSRTVDAALAERGRVWFEEQTLARGIVPRTAIQYLWLVWDGRQRSGEAFWSEFRSRYGFVEAPFDNGGLPLGIRDGGSGLLAFDCLSCHAGEVAGQVVIGAANTRVDFQSLYDDLVALNELAPRYGVPSLPVPFALEGFTGAAGVHDAFGLAMSSSVAYAGGINPGINVDYGYQRSPAWWTIGRKGRLYTDGSGAADGHRTMMAMLLAFGTPFSQLQASDEALREVAEYLQSLESPCWTQSALDEAAVERGRALFDAACASCHGVHSGPQAAFPERVVAASEVGTDPLRAERFGELEAAWVNESWFGEPPMRATGGYLAQPLDGIWARAPYFHNGSVPDLVGVLDPSQRPVRWRRTGSSASDYDASRVGWRYEEVASSPPADTRAGRAVYDTTRPGMSNAGHTYGSALGEAERADLLEYLRTL